MTERVPFLILHKVRGQPAFDIAIQHETDDEVMWIIPTSGHRAYPWCSLKVADLTQEKIELCSSSIMPASWPDHYADSDAPTLSFAATATSALLRTLGLGGKPINRRKV